MDADPSKNVVVFDINGREPYVAEGRTRDDQCIKRAWSEAPIALRAAALDVARIHSEWAPSRADADFIRRTFPRAELTYNFERPHLFGWDAALAAAGQAMRELDAKRAMDDVAEHGALLPILWSQTSPIVHILEHLPHRAVVPGRLFVALSSVATTPEGRIGMNHITNAVLDGGSFEALLDTAFQELTRGLKIEGLAEPERSGEMAVLRREGAFASSAVARPDFHKQMSSMLGDDRLLVGLPDPDTVLVTKMDSGWADELRRLVLTSHDVSRELVPCVFQIDSGGIRFFVERSD
jgi:hypothetical protein